MDQSDTYFIVYLDQPLASPGIKDGGTIITGQGAHKTVSAVVGPSDPTFVLSPIARGAFVEVPITIRSTAAFLASFENSLTTSPSLTLMA